jgi:hypothetical protein
VQENGPSVVNGLSPECAAALGGVPFRCSGSLPTLSHGRRWEVCETRRLDDLPIAQNVHSGFAGHPVYPDSDIFFLGNRQLLSCNTKTLIIERQGRRRRTYENRNSYPSQRHRTD